MNESVEKRTCEICGFQENGKKFSNHIFSKHKLKSKEYTIKYLYGGKEPTCLECGKEVRYVAFTFKEYCKEHRHIAESIGGRKGGTAKAWNKGLTKDDDVRIEKAAKKISGENNPFYGKTHSEETRKKISKRKKLVDKEIEKRIKESHGNWKLVQDYNKRNQYMLFECLACNTTQEKKLSDLERGTRCKICDKKSGSLQEAEVADFVESLDIKIERNVRYVINPKELDIWIPDLNVAIEYHGLYWHSRPDVDKNSHYDKWKMCQEKGIRLIQIFSDEWINRKEICKSIIINALGKTKHRIFARKCKVQQLDPAVARNLLDQWHIDGKTRSSAYFGLTYDGEIVSIISVRTPFHKRHSDAVEIARFASRLDTSVVGGLGKLMKAVKQYSAKKKKNKILTYTDFRIGTGKGYESVGFEYIGHTGVNYWHTDGEQRFNRFMFKADKGRGMTEKQICEEAGVHQVYGPGNGRYSMHL